MMIDVLVATFLSALLLLGLFQLADNTLQLNHEAQQLALAQTLLIDLEGLSHQAQRFGDSADPDDLPLNQPACTDSGASWLQDWCNKVDAVADSLGAQLTTCLALTGTHVGEGEGDEEVEAKIESGASNTAVTATTYLNAADCDSSDALRVSRHWQVAS